MKRISTNGHLIYRESTLAESRCLSPFLKSSPRSKIEPDVNFAGKSSVTLGSRMIVRWLSAGFFVNTKFRN